MIVDNPRALSLPPDTGPILRAMFSAYRRVTITEELAGGFSGSRVFVVLPLRADGLPELPAVVKLGPRSLIDREWQAYQNHIQNRLPGGAAIQGPPCAASETDWAGLRYPLVGSGTFTVESLEGYYRQATAEDLRYVLEMRLFRQLGSLWRFNQPAPDFALRNSYDHLLPVNLLIRPGLPPDGTLARVLDGETAGQYQWASGEWVQLQGFVVVEVAHAEGQITLNLPDAARSYRIRLLQVTVPEQFTMGETTVGFTGQIVSTRRETLAAIALETWGVAFAVDADTVTLPGGRTLPNPLVSLPAILAATPTVRLAPIHGDLNPQNILVDPETREVRLIDFADARRDHGLHDLLRLETSILTRLLPHSLQLAGLPPDVAVGLVEQLAQAPQMALDDITPGLHKAASMLAAVRNAARTYLFDPDDWSEYWHGLTLYLLGAHKYANLDETARKVAFLAAATAQQLVADSAVRTRTMLAPETRAVTRAPLPESERPPLPSPVTAAVAAPSARSGPVVPLWLPVAVVLVAMLALLGLLWWQGTGEGEVVLSELGARTAPADENAASVGNGAGAAAVAVPTPTPDCLPRGASSSVVVVLDRSRAMEGEKLLAAVGALQQFLHCLAPETTLAVYAFNDAAFTLEPTGPVAEARAPLEQRLGNLFAEEETALYDALCTVVADAEATGEAQETHVILLSAGPDTSSTRITEEVELAACVASGLRLHTIAYGDGADVTLLARLAQQTNGTFWQANPETVGETLRSIPLP